MDSFLNDRVLDHVYPVAGSDLSFDSDLLGSVLRQFAVEWLVLADEQIRFAVIGFEADWQPARDAFLRTIGVLFAGCVVIDVAGHVDDLAGNLFCFTRREFIFLAMLMAFMSDDWRCRE